MTTILSEARPAEKIGGALAAEHHRHLLNLRIRYLFADQKAPKKLTCKSFANPTILTPLHRFLSGGGGDQGEGDHVAVVINRELWGTLTAEQRSAVIDHALAHVWIETSEEGESKLVKLEHDLADFAEVIERHGLYFDDMRPTAEAIRQLPLLGGQGAAAVVDRVVEWTDRLAKGDREGIPETATEAWDRLTAPGGGLSVVTVTAGGGGE